MCWKIEAVFKELSEMSSRVTELIRDSSERELELYNNVKSTMVDARVELENRWRIFCVILSPATNSERIPRNIVGGRVA